LTAKNPSSRCVQLTQDLAQTFLSRLRKVEKILLVGHQATELTITNDLSKLPDPTVSFEQEQDVTDAGAIVRIKYRNIDRAQGKICFLVQGLKKK